MAKKSNGATTVSATSFLASLVGIRIFATGGLGGVHRDGHITMDVSADLRELGKTPVAVICAGVKSLLDIPRSLEYLETEGVPVVGYGTSEFPAFFTPTSGEKVSVRLDTPSECARLIQTQSKLNMRTGVVIAIPIPKESAAEGEFVETAIQTALQHADQDGIRGNAATPYLLAKVNELTKGESLKSNIALIKNNAKIASQIAVALHRLDHGDVVEKDDNGDQILVVGGVVVDTISRSLVKHRFGTSNPGTTTSHVGGVGHNIARALTQLNAPLTFVSVVGRDPAGDALLFQLSKANMDTSHIAILDNSTTAQYSAILDETGEMVTAIADMDIFSKMTSAVVLPRLTSKTPVVVLDGNLPEQTISEILDRATDLKVPTWFEPTSLEKASKCVNHIQKLTYLSPNRDELAEIAHLLRIKMGLDDDREVHTEVTDAIFLIRTGRLKHLLLKRGSEGVTFYSSMPWPGTTRAQGEPPVYVSKEYPPHLVDKIVDVTGAGDSMVGAILWGMFSEKEKNPDQVIAWGLEAAKLTLGSDESVSPAITPDRLRNHRTGST
eukprot:TRINITY_DN8620_c0_g1_i2.p1 TRINITY_DN8620_c0_g1~~TRINITY_DN8620_c0_g1_i2.p1  ORF type:complete len:553 (+),score=169.86 TRINITY_DN8620_c0_g1_i2:157-1815(+)